ncbi:MAG: hypothetical protein KGZ25_14460 [Planctomycetes bacterium]|nr:hypothetical protein [Planctomycetota bacterium]
MVRPPYWHQEWVLEEFQDLLDNVEITVTFEHDHEYQGEISGPRHYD